MKKQLFILAVFCLFSLVSFTQQTEKQVRPEIVNDTTYTLCEFIYDSISGQTSTRFCKRISVYKYMYPKIDQSKLDQDSITLRKQYVLQSVAYFVPIDIENITKFVSVPTLYIVQDYNFSREQLPPDPYKKYKEKLIKKP